MSHERGGEDAMSLDRAIYILTQEHTRDNAEVGFTVVMPTPWEWHPLKTYIEAWCVLRRSTGLQT